MGVRILNSPLLNEKLHFFEVAFTCLDLCSVDFIILNTFLVNFGAFRIFVEKSRNSRWRIQDGRCLET